MKKSEAIRIAMVAVVNSPSMSGEMKMDVIEILMAEKNLAEMVEEYEANKEDDTNV